jgi:hypothetical protein
MNQNASSRNQKRILNAIRNSDMISTFLQQNNINSEDLTTSNYTELIPQELVNTVVKQLFQNTSEKNEKKDFSKLSATLVDEHEFQTLCETNIKYNPVRLFQLAIDNSVEGKPLEKGDHIVSLIEDKKNKNI